MEKISIKLEKLKKTAINHWIKKNKKGTIESATGTGKSFMMCEALLTMPEDSSVVFLFETLSRRKTLQNEISKYEKLYNVKIHNKYNIYMSTYQSAYKWIDKHFDLVIADEFHDGLTPSYSNFFFNNSYDSIIGFSATIDRNVQYDTYTKGDLLDSIAPVCFTYSLEKSIANGTSRKLNIYLISHSLDAVTKNIKAGSKTKSFLSTEESTYDYWNKLFYKITFKKEKEKSDKFIIDKAIRMRSNLLWNLPSKKEIVNKLLDVVIGKTLIYANSIDSLLSVTNNVVSSRNNEDENENIIKAFDNNKINHIGSFKKLEQGINLSKLDNIILMSYYGKEKGFLQRMGRLRMDGNKTGNVFIIVTRKTQEEKWIKKSLEDKDFNIIECDNINDCLLKYVENE